MLRESDKFMKQFFVVLIHVVSLGLSMVHDTNGLMSYNPERPREFQENV